MSGHLCPHHCPKGTGSGAFAVAVIGTGVFVYMWIMSHLAEVMLSLVAIAGFVILGTTAIQIFLHLVTHPKRWWSSPQWHPQQVHRARDKAVSASGKKVIQGRVVNRKAIEAPKRDPALQSIQRQQALMKFHEGDICHFCGSPMYSWQSLDLDHLTPVASGGAYGEVALTHAHCNRAAGARIKNSLYGRWGGKARPRRRRRWWS